MWRFSIGLHEHWCYDSDIRLTSDWWLVSNQSFIEHNLIISMLWFSQYFNINFVSILKFLFINPLRWCKLTWNIFTRFEPDAAEKWQGRGAVREYLVGGSRNVSFHYPPAPAPTLWLGIVLWIFMVIVVLLMVQQVQHHHPSPWSDSANIDPVMDVTWAT